MIALIDGDPFVYQATWHITVTYKKYLKRLKEKLDKGEYTQEKYDRQLVAAERSFNTTGFKKAQKNIDKLLNDTIESVFATDWAIAVGGPTNFRKDVHPEYKINSGRKSSTDNKPVWFEDLKHYLADREGAVVSENCEADDLLRIWSLECAKDDKEFIICSIDKDLDCIPGWHFVNIRPHKKGSFSYEVTEEYAEWFYWYQLLMGDNVDAIPGIKGCGPKTAKKILTGASNHEEYKAAVFKAYNKAYGEDGFEHMLFNARLLHIWRFKDDHFKMSREEYNEHIKG